MKSMKWLAVAGVLVAGTAMAGMVSSPVEWKGEGEASYGVTAEAGWLQGMAHEYVYASVPQLGYKGTMSRLDWEIENLWMGGVEAGARWGRLTLNGGVWSALNDGGSSTMMDYDWMDIPGVAVSSGFSYSETASDSEVDQALLADANVGYDFLRLDSGLWAAAFVGARYEKWSWDAKGLSGGCGFPEYDIWEEESLPKDTTVISYDQEYLYGYLGARAGWQIGCVDLGGYVAWAPAYHVKDRDNHRMRETIFKTDNDYDSHVMLYGVAAKVGLSDSWTLALSWEALNTGTAATSGTQIGGEDEDDEDDDDDDEDDDSSTWSGIKMRNSMVSLSLSYTF